MELNIRKIDMYFDYFDYFPNERKMTNQGQKVETLPRIPV
jgi:hypothetical protein